MWARVRRNDGAHDCTCARFIEGHAVGKFNSRGDDVSEGHGPVFAKGDESGFDHARDYCGHQARYRNNSLEAAGLQSHEFAWHDAAVTEHLRRRFLRHGADSRERDYLPSFVRIRIGASPPNPKWENSHTDAANIAARPPSTALPPL